MVQQKFDIISVGDATIDHFILFHDATVNCRIDKVVCQLTMNYADKLPVDNYIKLVAGNAANNAVGSSRLGLKTAYYSELGDDEGGRKIKQKLESEGVDSSFIYLRPGAETNNSFVLSFQGERTILVYHVEREYKLPALPASEWVYLTSTGHGYEPLFKEVLEYVKKSGAKLAFNPGTFQLRGDKELMMQCFAQSEVLFINVQEAQGILASTDKNIKNLLAEMRKLGPAIVVITDGPNGGYVFDGKDYFYIPEFTLERVETTGAGDSFGTAFIAALHHGKSIDEAMRWASFNASSVVMFIGPQEGLLTKPAIEQQLETYPEYKAIVFTDKDETPVLPPFKSPAVETNLDNQKI